jgi:hypothetical protein
MANRYKDPDELNNRYIPEDDDDGEDIPEEELTEEERETIKMFERFTPEIWQQLYDLFMDEEDYTLSNEEYGAKNIIGTLDTTNPVIDNNIKLGLAKSISTEEAFYIIERLKKKPEEGANIPPEILEMIYAKAKEYKG